MMRVARGKAALVLALAVVLSLLAAQPALATFHEVMVREVYPGSTAGPDSEYVELQMWSPGQNLVDGHKITVFDADGSPTGSATFSADVPGGASQSTLVAATPGAEAEFGFSADTVLAPGLLDPAGGAACWESLDCVAWGSFGGAAKLPVGQPAAPGGIPDGMAIRRTISPGCATLLEPGDDRDNSALDFSSVFPSPRPNSVAPSERPCAGQGAGGGSGVPEAGSGDDVAKRPQTRIQSRPGRRTRDRTPTFRFTSSVQGSTYLCKLDGRGFKPCRSPHTVPRLRYGPHIFKVKARTLRAGADPTPSECRFDVVKP